jgi:hypothetical protein
MSLNATIVLILLIISYIISEPLIDFPRWYRKSKPEKISKYKSILDYLKIGTCQDIDNRC